MVCPFDQRYVPELLLDKTTLPPVQNATGPLAEIVGTGPLLVTLTVTAGDVALFPLAPVTVTV